MKSSRSGRTHVARAVIEALRHSRWWSAKGETFTASPHQFFMRRRRKNLSLSRKTFFRRLRSSFQHQLPFAALRKKISVSQDKQIVTWWFTWIFIQFFPLHLPLDVKINAKRRRKNRKALTQKITLNRIRTAQLWNGERSKERRSCPASTYNTAIDVPIYCSHESFVPFAHCTVKAILLQGPRAGMF